MLQSQQVWLPELQEPTKLEKIIDQSHHAQKFIAHCAGDAKVDLAEAINSATDSQNYFNWTGGEILQKMKLSAQKKIISSPLPWEKRG